MNVIIVHEAILNDFWKKVTKIPKLLDFQKFLDFFKDFQSS